MSHFFILQFYISILWVNFFYSSTLNQCRSRKQNATPYYLLMCIKLLTLFYRLIMLFICSFYCCIIEVGILLYVVIIGVFYINIKVVWYQTLGNFLNASSENDAINKQVRVQHLFLNNTI